MGYRLKSRPTSNSKSKINLRGRLLRSPIISGLLVRELHSRIDLQLAQRRRYNRGMGVTGGASGPIALMTSLASTCGARSRIDFVGRAICERICNLVAISRG
jgi:hypothetical protein